MVQHGHDLLDAHRIGPGQRSARIVDALLHGDIDGSHRAHTLVDGVGRLVGQHGDRAHDGQARHVVQARDDETGRLEQAHDGRVGGIAALVGARHGNAFGSGVIERQVEQHRIRMLVIVRALGGATPVREINRGAMAMQGGGFVHRLAFLRDAAADGDAGLLQALHQAANDAAVATAIAADGS